MHKLTLPTIILFLSFFYFLPTSNAFSGSGNGTLDTPYLITSCEHLGEINTDTEHLNAAYRLDATINCAGMGNSIMIGNSFAPFTGTFNGNSNQIEIDINVEDQDNTALFRAIEDAVIRDLNVIGEVDHSGSGSIVGGVVGYLYNSLVTNVNSSVYIETSTEYVGGVVGWSEFGTIISSSFFNANVQGAGYVGGVAGYIENESLVTQSLANNGVVAGDEYIGGLIGSIATDDCVVSQSYTFIVVSGQDSTGGFVGENYGQIYNSYSRFIVTGTDHTGGFAGVNEGEIVNSYSRSNVTVNDGGSYAGGFVGTTNSGSVTSSFSIGAVNLENSASEVGGFMGGVGDVTYSDVGWWTGSGPIFAIANKFGEGAIETLDYNESSVFNFSASDHAIYSSWDFEDVWEMCDFPTLIWQDLGCEDGGDDDEDSSTTFSKDTRCHNVKPQELTWIVLEPMTKDGVNGTLITWTQYFADKINIKIDDGTGKYPWQIEKTLNDGHEFLENVANWQNIKVQAVNGCKKGNWSTPVSHDKYPNGWFNL